jgi:crossover junction endodeoxyribonuclease RusA
MPPRQKLLNANDRLNRYAEARIVKQLRSDGFKLAKCAKVPLLERAQIDCVYEPPTNGRRDAANWQDSAKAITDGFVDAGVLRDDSTAYLAGPFMHIGEKHPGGRLVLYITEITNEDPS